MNKFDLEQCLIQFAIDVIKVFNTLNGSYASQHVSKQLIRSSTAATLNDGKAQRAESSNDFIHKIKLCLKDLRESLVNLKIQKGADLSKSSTQTDLLTKKNTELFLICVASMRTSQNKNR